MSVVEVLRAFVRDEGGQGLVEYAMLLGIVVFGVAVALDLLGDTVTGTLTRIRIALSGLPWD